MILAMKSVVWRFHSGFITVAKGANARRFRHSRLFYVDLYMDRCVYTEDLIEEVKITSQNSEIRILEYGLEGERYAFLPI